MGTKNDPGEFDCYASALPDEPMFVLLGRDPDAAVLVALWAAMRRLRDIDEHAEKIAEAEQCAEDMAEYVVRSSKTPAGVFTVAQAVTLLAELHASVLTITLEPKVPLRMGSYYPIVEVRPKLPRNDT